MVLAHEMHYAEANQMRIPILNSQAIVPARRVVKGENMRRLPKFSSVLMVLAITLMVGVPAAFADTDNTPVGTVIDDFQLQDFRGRVHALSEFYEDADVVVIAFLGTECPLAKLYVPRLVELADEFESRRVAFVGVSPNRQDSMTDLLHFADRNKVDFPILKDTGNTIADAFSAIRVPEMFVLDKTRTIRYWGRVDDQYGFQTGVGYQKPKPERRDLAEAINEVLAGSEVSVAVTPAPGCRIGRVRIPDNDSDVTYSNQIARIFENRCVECHRKGQIAPFAMTGYDELAGWAEMIAEVVNERRMPPWYADPQFGTWKNDCRLSDEEIDQVNQWVAAGAPEGDPAQLPERRKFIDGWTLPVEPDQIVYMSDEPYVVPAEGTVEYQYFEADPGFTEDVYIRGAECLPGDRSVVHHIIVFIKAPDFKLDDSTPEGIPARTMLSGTAPGNPPLLLPDGMAMKVPAGSTLIFQMHYTATGTETADRSSVGLVFADPKDVTHLAETGLAINPLFEIPAQAEDYEVRSMSKFRKDGLLVFLMPHLHLRGKAFRYELEYPDKTRETVLDIPRYDFNWQNSYYFDTPKYVPKGSKMRCYAKFDNSSNNLANPDPDNPVRWGDQTWEEMMIGWFVWAPLDKDSSQAANSGD